MKFGENLYQLRKSAKLSQETLAEKVGVSRQSVSKWENGDAYPEMENIMKLCKIFHCKINDLVHDNIQDIDSLDEEIKMTKVKFEKDKQKRLKIISKIIYVIAKIGKIFTRIGVVGLSIALIIGSVFIGSTNIEPITENEDELVFKIGNFSVNFQVKDSELKLSTQNPTYDFIKIENEDEFIKFINVFKEHSKPAIFIVFIASFVLLIATLIVLSYTLKHLELLFKNIYDGDTPFTLENVFHIKRMTYLMIAVMILPAFANAISSIIFNNSLNINIGTSLITILFLYSIAYIFEYGYQIQLDSNGRIYDKEDDKENAK